MNKNNFYGIDLTKNVSSNFLDFMTSIYNDASKRFYTQKDNITFNQKVRDDFDKLSKKYDSSVIEDLKEKNYNDDAIAYYYDREELYDNLVKVENLVGKDVRFKDNFVIDPDIIEDLPGEIIKKLNSYEDLNEVKDSGMFVDTNVNSNMAFDNEDIKDELSNKRRVELEKEHDDVGESIDINLDDYIVENDIDLNDLDF